jgi:hypothetical protein
MPLKDEIDKACQHVHVTLSKWLRGKNMVLVATLFLVNLYIDWRQEIS